MITLFQNFKCFYEISNLMLTNNHARWTVTFKKQWRSQNEAEEVMLPPPETNLLRFFWRFISPVRK